MSSASSPPPASSSTSTSFTVRLFTLDCVFDLSPYPLVLRSAFGTSHSSSTTRENGLLTLNIGSGEGGVTAYGEVGLPPRKVGCYEATFASIQATMCEFETFVRYHTFEQFEIDSYTPFEDVPEPYFHKLRHTLTEPTSFTNEVRVILHLFHAIDTFLHSKSKRATDAAWLCLMEVTLFDAWGRLRGEMVCEMIGRRFDANESTLATHAAADTPAVSASIPALPSPPNQPRSFYTLGMDSLPTMLSNLTFGLRFTPLIKIKVDADVDRTKCVLDAVVAEMDAHADPSWSISIDANASWSTPSIARSFLTILAPLKDRITMVEQPFPLFRACPKYIDKRRPDARMQVIDGEYIDLDKETITEWTLIAQEYAAHGLLIYADESICTSSDLHALRPLLHGVNVKLEKAGGYRGALDLLDAASRSGVHTWIGCMVGSTLNASQATHLLPHAVDDCWGDLDGSLLTQPASDRFTGGMQWSEGNDTQRATGVIRMDNTGKGGCGCIIKNTTTQQ